MASQAVSGGQGRFAQAAMTGSLTVALSLTGAIDPVSPCYGPFAVLLKEDRADQPCDGVLTGKDADDAVGSLDPDREAFDGAGRVQLRQVLLREGHGGKGVGSRPPCALPGWQP